MTDIVGMGATTHVVEQGSWKVRVTKQALEDLSEQVKGGLAFPLTIDHDPSLLPLGKLADAWVEPYGDEFALFHRVYLEDSVRLGVHKRSGTAVVTLHFEEDPRPFARMAYDQLEDGSSELSADLANFDALEAYREFARDVVHIDTSISCDHRIVRHSFTPEPLLQFVVANPEIAASLAVGVWLLRRVEKFVRYTVDETLRKTADDIADALSTKLRHIVQSYLRHRRKDDRATTTNLVVPGKLTLNLLVRTSIDEQFPPLELNNLVAEMEKFGDILKNADNATFQKSGTDSWRFLYVTTSSGKVLGTLECYENAIETLRKFNWQESQEEDQ